MRASCVNNIRLKFYLSCLPVYMSWSNFIQCRSQNNKQNWINHSSTTSIMSINVYVVFAIVVTLTAGQTLRCRSAQYSKDTVKFIESTSVWRECSNVTKFCFVKFHNWTIDDVSSVLILILFCRHPTSLESYWPWMNNLLF